MSIVSGQSLRENHCTYKYSIQPSEKQALEMFYSPTMALNGAVRAIRGFGTTGSPCANPDH